MSENMAD